MINSKNIKVIIMAIFCLLLIIVGIIFLIEFLPSTKKHPEQTNSTDLEADNQMSQASIMLNEEVLTKEACIYSDYVMLPMVSILEKLGANITWTSNDSAEVSFLNNSFTLSLSQTSFIDNATHEELLIPAPGSKNFHSTAVQKDILIDSETLSIILAYHFETKIEVNFDSENNIVLINKE